MYKFQKLRLKFKGLVIDYDWMLVIENFSDLFNFENRVFDSKIMPAVENLIDSFYNTSHINTELGVLINVELLCFPDYSLYTVIDKIYKSFLETKNYYLKKYRKVYINKMGGILYPSDNIEVIDECCVENDNLIFPEYTEKDIRIKKWENGVHHYAYVGDFQVISSSGISKWKEGGDALDAAKSFLEKVNNNHFLIKEGKI